MKNDDIELLREVQKNTEMGMHALEVINPKVYDDSMALMLARESFNMAEMLIRGSSMGMTSLWKAMNRNEKADGQALELAGELLDFEENNIRELKRYL